MKEEVQIRRVAWDELVDNRDALVALLGDIAKENLPMVPSPEGLALADYERLLTHYEDGSAVLIGAFTGRRVVAILWAYRRMVHGQLRMHVAQLGVDTSHRLSGIGSALLDALEHTAASEGIPVIELMATLGNHCVARFYECQGFVPKRVLLERNVKGF